MPLHIKDSSSWREAKQVYVKQSGAWQEISEVYIKDSGTWLSVFKNLPSYTSVTSSNIGTIVDELITDYSDIILSAGPLFGTTKSNTAGAYEIVVAPGIRLEGDTSTSWNKTKRYVIEVTSSGFSYSTAGKYKLNNTRGSLNTTTANNNLKFEQDIPSFTTGTVLEFNHPVRWGNSNNSSASTTFTYTLPRGTSSYTMAGGGGGGGSNNQDGDSTAGKSGDSGGFRTNQSVSKSSGTVVNMIVGQGGVGACYKFNPSQGLSIHPNAQATDNASNSLWNNFYSFGRGEAGTTTSLKFGSDTAITATGGGGGIASYGDNNVYSPSITGQATGPGSPNGVAGVTATGGGQSTTVGANTGLADDVGDGGDGRMSYAESGNDGAIWITLT